MPRTVDSPAAAAARGAGVMSDYSPLKNLLNFQSLDDTALQAGNAFIQVIQEAVGQIFGVIQSFTGIDLSPIESLFTGALGGTTGTPAGTTVPGIDLTQYTSTFSSILNPTTLINAISSVIGIGNLGTVLPNILSFLGGGTTNFGATGGTFNLSSAASTFINLILSPTNLLPLLSGGLLSGSVIPGLDASKIISGTFGASLLQPLIDAISTGFGGASGLNFGSLTSLLSAIPGAQQLIDTIANALGISGTNLSLSTVTTALQNIPGVNIVTSLLASVIPGLDASKITSGSFPQSMITGLPAALISAGGGIIDQFVNTFLGLSGSGFSLTDLGRAITSIPGSLISGTLPPGIASNLGVGMISNVLPELLTNPTFDTANSIIGQGAWTWDGTQGPGSLMTSVFTDATGILKELFSNVIHVQPGQTLNISANTQWSGFTGGANSIALTVAQFANGVLSSYQTIASVASPGTSSGGFTPLSGTYTVPSGIDAIFVRPTVTAGATAGRVWFGGMSTKPTATNLLTSLVPGLDASKIISGQFGIGMITNLATMLLGFATGSSIISQLIGLFTGTTTGLSGLSGLGSIWNDITQVVGSPTALGSGSPVLPGIGSIPLLGGLLSGGGSSFLTSLIPGLDASKITTGTFADATVPGLGSLMDNIFNGVSGSAASGTNQSAVNNATAAQSNTLIGQGGQIAQIKAALGSGTPDSDDFERATLGAQWTFLATSGAASDDGHSFHYSGTGSSAEFVMRKNDIIASTDHITSSVVLTQAIPSYPLFTPLPYGSYIDVWVRMTAFTTYATRSGVRLRVYSAAPYTANWSLDNVVNGVVTNLATGNCPQVGAGASISLEAGAGGTTRRYLGLLNGATIGCDFTDVSTTTIGASNRCRGFGGKGNSGVGPTLGTADINQWTATG